VAAESEAFLIRVGTRGEGSDIAMETGYPV
jgi:hypothetical protein